jgi:hypothetical protein
MASISSIARLPEFERDLKALTKRFRTLPDDLHLLIDTELRLYHELETDNGGIIEVTGTKPTEARIFKVRKFACRSLRGKGVRSGLRLIYAYFKLEGRIELVEIYFKGDKENEDRERLRKHYSAL